MKLLMGLMMVLIASVLAALLAAEEPGYVLIIYQDWKLESSVTLLVTLLAITGVVLYYLLSSFGGLMHVPKRVGSWRKNRRQGRAETTLNRGMLALFEGDWKQAEKLLVKTGKLSHSPLLNYLGAARAAQQQGAFEQGDEYLRKAALIDGSATVAVGLTQARLLLDQKQYEQALACLENLHKITPKHPYVLRLLAELYRTLSDWQRLEDLLPALKRLKVFNEQAFFAIQRDCYVALLIQQEKSDDYHTLLQLWRRLPRVLHQDVEVVQHYVQQLSAMAAYDEAEAILRTTLANQWDSKLLALYGQLKVQNGQQQLKSAEAWLLKHGADAQLFHILGQICMHNQLWGKARDYLQRSLDMGQQQALPELIEVLDQLGESELANSKLRQGLSLLKS